MPLQSYNPLTGIETTYKGDTADSGVASTRFIASRYAPDRNYGEGNYNEQLPEPTPPTGLNPLVTADYIGCQSQATTETTNAPATNTTQISDSQVPETTTPKKGSGNINKIASAINQGYSTAEEIANFTGSDLQSVKDTINNDPDLAYLMKQSQNQNDLDEAHTDFVNKMAAIANGSIGLTTAEQAQIEQSTKLWEQIRNNQLTANKNYEGGITTSNIRSGRQEFMNEIASGVYKQAIDDGANKIAQIDADSIKAISDLQELFKQNKYKEASEKYNELTTYLQNKSVQIDKMHEATVKLYEKQAQILKEENQAKINEYNQSVLLEKEGIEKLKIITPALINSLTGDDVKDSELISGIAIAYDLDENIVKGLIQSGLDEKEKNAPKLTHITYKGVTTWYDDKGNVVKKTGATNTPTPTTPTTGISKADEQTILNAVNNGIKSNREAGSQDNYLSPDDYAQAKSDWMSRGGSATAFETKFKGYKNPKNTNYR
jgi:hypothetical protein